MTIIEKIREVIIGTQFAGKSFIAGGFVRDQVMGNHNSKDIDIVVELPNGGIELAKFLSDKLHGTNVVIFERFGTAQIVVDHNELEFVMTRKEVYTPGSRKPETFFGTIQDDIKRRDFTINSMLQNIVTGEIIDMAGGKQDINDKLIKATSDPEHIFTEDPLRMLRAVRFAARFDFEIDEETFKCIKRNHRELRFISKERIRDEFIKILASAQPIRGINLMVESGLMEMVLPEFLHTIGLTQNKFHDKDAHGHIIDVIKNIKSTWQHRLSALLHDIGKIRTRTVDEQGNVHFYGHEVESEKITRDFMKDLKFSNEEIELIASAVRNHMVFTGPFTAKTIRRKRMILGEKAFELLVDLGEADRKSHIDFDPEIFVKIKDMAKDEPVIDKKKLPVDGKWIMEIFGLKQGPLIGEILDAEMEFLLDTPNATQKQIEDFIVEWVRVNKSTRCIMKL